MKVLIFGNGNDGFIKSYIEYVLLKLGANITLVTPKVTNNYQDFYKKEGITIIKYELPRGLIYRIPKFRVIIAQYLLHRKIKRTGQYDFYHIHYVEKWACLQVFLAQKSKERILLSFWGSDLYRSNKFDNLMIKKCLTRAHKITLTTQDMQEKFHEIYGLKFNNKLVSTKFGTQIYDRLINLEINESMIESKRKLNLPENKIIVVCGYNRNIEQQHISILHTLTEIPLELKERIYLLIPMTYGTSNDQYVRQVREAFVSSGYEGLVLNQFLSDDDMARFRRCGDIFIHLQTTDAFSASMQEHLFAGSVVINGSWLKYKELDEKTVFYYRIDEVSELAVLMPEMINNLEEVKKKAELNRGLMGDSLSWQSIANQWAPLYE